MDRRRNQTSFLTKGWGFLFREGAMIRKYEGYMGIILCLFVLFVLNSLCLGQTSQTGTKRIMIKGQMVDVPVFTTKGGSPTYYDAHPEERAMDAATQANKPLMDIYQKSIEDIRIREQGYGGGSYRDYPSQSSPPPPYVPEMKDDSPTVLWRVPGGAWGKDRFYPEAKGGLIDPKTGEFLPAVKGGYLTPGAGKFIPGQ